MYIQGPRENIDIERRIRWIIRVVIGITVILIFRLFLLQVLQGDYFRSMAENNRIRLIRTRTPRGIIYDRNGIPLATNRRVFSIFFDPAGSEKKENKESLNHLKQLLIQRQNLLGEVIAREAESKELYFKPRKIAEDVDFTTVASIREQSLDLPGVYVKDEFIRYYPLGHGTAHLMGYLRGITVDELQKPQYEDYELDDVVGRNGIEQIYEQYLRGIAGGWMIEVDARGRKRRDIGSITPMPGNSLILSIDYRLQQKAYDLLNGKRGTIIAIDPSTGGILAMVSEPSYDSNLMSGYIPYVEWARIVNDPGRPLNNRTTMGTYPPGSIFKLITALAALDNNNINPNTTFYCPGYFYLGNHPFKCHKKEGHGTLNLNLGIAYSCNVYFYRTAQLVGLENLQELATQFGIGQRTGIDLLNEQDGFLPGINMIKKARKEGWYMSETIQEGIGQGTLLVTPLQMVNVVATIANGGTRYRPFIVKQIEDGSGTIIYQTMPEIIRQIPLSEETWNIVRRGMWSVVNAGGTGGLARLPDIEAAGKTGTAQSGTGEKDIAWFCGYAPFNKPEIAVLTMVEEGGFGGVAAAPLAKEIFSTYFSQETTGILKKKQPEPEKKKESGQQVAMVRNP